MSTKRRLATAAQRYTCRLHLPDNNLPTTFTPTLLPFSMLTLSMSMEGQALHKLQNWEIMVEV